MVNIATVAKTEAFLRCMAHPPFESMRGIRSNLGRSVFDVCQNRLRQHGIPLDRGGLLLLLAKARCEMAAICRKTIAYRRILFAGQALAAWDS
jgi:hypothetical protein